MPSAAPRHCPRGHPPFIGSRCPACAAAFKASVEARRPNATGRGYDSKWRREARAFLAEHPTCGACGAPSAVVDHATPHKGDQRLFWDRTNWRPLCRPCHDRKTATRDGGFGRAMRGDGRASPKGTGDRPGGLARSVGQYGTSDL